MKAERGIVRVMVVEDHRGTREALAVLLAGTPGYACVGAFGSAALALEELGRLGPQVVLVDLELPGMGGVEFVRRCRERYPAVELVVLTIHDEAERVMPALEAGAGGYLVKGLPPAKLLEAITEVALGGAPMSGSVARMVLQAMRKPSMEAGGLAALTAREVEVLRGLGAGLRYGEIAGRLGLSPRTVNSHLQRVYRKLRVHSATGAVAQLHAAERTRQS